MSNFTKLWGYVSNFAEVWKSSFIIIYEEKSYLHKSDNILVEAVINKFGSKRQCKTKPNSSEGQCSGTVGKDDACHTNIP